MQTINKNHCFDINLKGCTLVLNELNVASIQVDYYLSLQKFVMLQPIAFARAVSSFTK